MTPFDSLILLHRPFGVITFKLRYFKLLVIFVWKVTHNSINSLTCFLKKHTMKVVRFCSGIAYGTASRWLLDVFYLFKTKEVLTPKRINTSFVFFYSIIRKKRYNVSTKRNKSATYRKMANFSSRFFSRSAFAFFVRENSCTWYTSFRKRSQLDAACTL